MKPENCCNPNEREHRGKNLLAGTAFAVLKGYARFLRSLLLLFAAGVFILASGFVVVYPLWFLAAKYKSTYGLLTLAMILLITAVLFARRVSRNVTAAGGSGPYLRKRLVPFLLRIAGTTAGAGALYGGVLLYAHGHVAGGALGTLVFLAALGAVLFTRHDPV